MFSSDFFIITIIINIDMFSRGGQGIQLKNDDTFKFTRNTHKQEIHTNTLTNWPKENGRKEKKKAKNSENF